MARKRRRMGSAAVALLGMAMAMPAQAAPDLNAVINPQFGGTKKYDGWANFNFSSLPGYGSFPGSTPWTTPIAANQAGSSGTARLNKVSGNGYVAGESIYVGSFSGAVNTLTGTFSVAETAPVANLATVALQIEIGEASGYDFYNHLTPVLTYNNGQAIAPSAILAPVKRLQQQNGTFNNPDTGEDVPVYVNSWLLQWDMRGLGTITDYKVGWGAVAHSQMYAFRLDQSNTFSVAVPEPGCVGMIGMAGLSLLAQRRRSKR